LGFDVTISDNRIAEIHPNLCGGKECGGLAKRMTIKGYSPRFVCAESG
jgi:hypothetical protein